MTTDSMFLRLVGGNVANPTLTDNKISAHTFIAALQMVTNGEITKAQMVAQYDLTHADDSADLDNFIDWYSSANDREQFANVLEWRIILARDKRTAAGGVDLDGSFGYAIKSKLLDGADSSHSFNPAVVVAASRFNKWASKLSKFVKGLEVSREASDQVVKLERTGFNSGIGFIYANGNEVFGVNDGTRYPFLVRQGAPTGSVVIEPSGQVTTGGKVVVGGAILPKVSGTTDLGSVGNKFRDLYLTRGTLFLGEETLKISADGALEFSGAGGVRTPASDPEWLDLTRASANQSGIVTGTDIIMDSFRGNGIAYDTTTGIVSLKAGFTYRLFATFAMFSLQSSDTVAIEWVKASDNVQLAAAHETRIRPANANSNGCNANTIEIIYKATVDTNVKLRCTEYTGSPDAVTMYWERSMATVVRL